MAQLYVRHASVLPYPVFVPRRDGWRGAAEVVKERVGQSFGGVFQVIHKKFFVLARKKGKPPQESSGREGLNGGWAWSVDWARAAVGVAEGWA